MKVRPGFFSRALKVFVLTLFFLALLLIFDPRGLSEEDSFVMPSNVRELAVLDVEPELISVVNTSQDFDGDGVPDVVHSERPIRGLLLANPVLEPIIFVDSGRTGERLFAVDAERAAHPSWYGDYDKNGTMDIAFQMDEEWHVFGLVKE